MDFEGAKRFITQKLKAELPAELSYHNYGHIKDVYQVAGDLAALEGVKGEALQLLLTAALFHDSGYTLGRNDHETLSCELAQKHLPTFGYNTDEIEVICGMIAATRLPQNPQNLLEEIICDADLDYLGRDDFWKIGNNLYLELRSSGLVRNEDDWNRQQVKFLEAHHYFTRSAISLRSAVKNAHLAEVKALLKP